MPGELWGQRARARHATRWPLVLVAHLVVSGGCGARLLIGLRGQLRPGGSAQPWHLTHL